jgi:hypothetical protein
VYAAATDVAVSAATITSAAAAAAAAAAAGTTATVTDAAAASATVDGAAGMQAHNLPQVMQELWRRFNGAAWRCGEGREVGRGGG